MTRRRWFFLGLLAASGVVFALSHFWGDNRSTVTLADGSRLTLEAVSAGQQCAHFYGSFLARLGEQLPDSMRRHLPRGRNVNLYFLTGTNLVFWFRVSRVPSVPQNLQFAIGDEQGTFAVIQSPNNIQSLPHGGAALHIAESVWPRRSKTIRLRIYDAALSRADHLVGELQIPNPVPGSPPNWTPTELPATNQSGELAVTLTRFDLRPAPTKFWRLSGTNVLEPVAFMAFRPTNPAAQLMTVRIADATGNYRTWRRLRPPTIKDGLTLISELRIPWPGEEIFALETGWLIERSPASTEVITVSNIVLAENLKPPGLVGGGTSPGGQFQIYARKRARPEDGWTLRAFHQSAQPSSPDLPTHELSLLEVRDDQGRSWLPGSGGDVEVPSDAGTVTATLAARALNHIRFVARPERRSSLLPIPPAN